MRTLVFSTVLTTVLGFAVGVSAQGLYDRCNQKKSSIDQMKNQSTQLDMEIGRIDEQLRELERKQHALRSDKAAKMREKGQLARTISREELQHKKMCRALGQCDAYENKVARLREQLEPVSEKLRRIRTEMRERNQESAGLTNEVQQIETEYGRLNCDNLEPGKAAQQTVDRCGDLFSQWNKLQARINQLQASVKAFRDRYKRVMDKMRVRNAELARLLKQMRDSCSHSSKLAELERMDKEQHEYQSIRTDLDDMDAKVKRFRRLQFRRPKMMKGQGPKPVLKPKNNKRSTIKPKNR